MNKIWNFYWHSRLLGDCSSSNRVRGINTTDVMLALSILFFSVNAFSVRATFISYFIIWGLFLVHTPTLLARQRPMAQCFIYCVLSISISFMISVFGDFYPSFFIKFVMIQLYIAFIYWMFKSNVIDLKSLERVCQVLVCVHAAFFMFQLGHYILSGTFIDFDHYVRDVDVDALYATKALSDSIIPIRAGGLYTEPSFYAMTVLPAGVFLISLNGRFTKISLVAFATTILSLSVAAIAICALLLAYHLLTSRTHFKYKVIALVISALLVHPLYIFYDKRVNQSSDYDAVGSRSKVFVELERRDIVDNIFGNGFFWNEKNDVGKTHLRGYEVRDSSFYIYLLFASGITGFIFFWGALLSFLGKSGRRRYLGYIIPLLLFKFHFLYGMLWIMLAMFIMLAQSHVKPGAKRRVMARQSSNRPVSKTVVGFWAIMASLIQPTAQAATADLVPPGVVVAHQAALSGIYLGSPSIIATPDGAYLASYDTFGPRSSSDTVYVMRSRDKGASWQFVTKIIGQYWSTLFVIGNAVYLFGTDRSLGTPVIRRSMDDGATWTIPRDTTSGRFPSIEKHITAPVPVVVQGGRIWRAFEKFEGGSLVSFVESAPSDSDLLNVENWKSSIALRSDSKWLMGHFETWEEGNVVPGTNGTPALVLRVNSTMNIEYVALVSLAADGTSMSFDPQRDFVEFPGGEKKFTIRYDSITKLYWTLSSASFGVTSTDNLERVRNTLVLMSSANLRDWTIRKIELHHPDKLRHGFQYADWQFSGDDIIAVVRTAYDDQESGAHSQHDSNYITFHCFKKFRHLQ